MNQQPQRTMETQSFFSISSAAETSSQPYSHKLAWLDLAERACLTDNVCASKSRIDDRPSGGLMSRKKARETFQYYVCMFYYTHTYSSFLPAPALLKCFIPCLRPERSAICREMTKRKIKTRLRATVTARKSFPTISEYTHRDNGI